MKKILPAITIAVLVLISLYAYADVTVYNNGTQKGRVEQLNIKSANSTTSITRSGQTATLDISKASGLNWTDVRAFATSFGGDHSGLNWQSVGV